MARQSNRTPFNRDEWVKWRDDTLVIQAEITEQAIHAGAAYGPLAEDRGRRIVRDLQAYREYVGKLAFNKIADANQLDFDWIGNAS
jgi:hypothetical protein